MDPTAIEAVRYALESVPSDVYGKIAKDTKIQASKIKSRFASSYKNHLETTYKRCSHVKTIASDDTSVPIDDVYVNLGLSSLNRKIEDRDLINLAVNEMPTCSIISGTAGSGKTMMMKYLSTEIYKAQYRAIPLFVELRQLNFAKHRTLYHAIGHLVTSTPTRTLSESDMLLLFAGLERGAFVLLLDGLDEVEPKDRDNLALAIQKIRIDFPETRVIVSTRPEIDVASWNSFVKFSIASLNFEQARSIIARIPRRDKLKSTFLEEFDARIFTSNKSLLETPLLLSILFLTYREFLNIPDEMIEFFEQAYETLYRRHDSYKMFRRPHYSGLNRTEFRKLFQALCFRTRAFRKITFTENELEQHIEKASIDSGIRVKPSEFRRDLHESVCLVMRDGLHYHFVHREFQDYFAAHYLISQRGEDTYEKFDHVLTDGFVSKVHQHLFELDKNCFEQEWVIPTIEEFLSEWDRHSIRENHGRIGASHLHEVSIYIAPIKIRSFKRKTPSRLWESIKILSHHYTFTDFLEVEHLHFIDNTPPSTLINRMKDFDSEKYGSGVQNLSNTNTWVISESDEDWLCHTTFQVFINNWHRNFEKISGKLRDNTNEKTSIGKKIGILS